MTKADILLALDLEHRNIRKLIDICHEQVSAAESRDQIDHDLLGSLLEYFRLYPDSCHHPKEDLIYRKLEARDPSTIKRLSNLIEEHAELAKLTERLAAHHQNVRGQDPSSDQRLISDLRHFVDFYRHHMEMEEKYFFPIARQRLSDDDWAEIDFSLFDGKDPVFDEKQEDRFRGLREAIALKSNDLSSRRETWLPDRITSVNQFNLFVQDHAQGYRLLHQPEGGYQLMRDGELVVAIPEGSETRAAWCAYYFLKGANILPK